MRRALPWNHLNSKKNNDDKSTPALPSPSTSDLQEIVQLTVDMPAYLILVILRFALLNFMNTDIRRSESKSYFRSL